MGLVALVWIRYPLLTILKCLVSNLGYENRLILNKELNGWRMTFYSGEPEYYRSETKLNLSVSDI